MRPATKTVQPITEKTAAQRDKSKPKGDQPDPASEYDGSILGVIREWGDALIIAFVLAMFIRVFVVELFKIPTGSMTPTLLGDYVAEVDLNKDSQDDLVVRGQNQTLVFMNKGDHYEADDEASEELYRRENLNEWMREGRFKPQYDRILVNKFAYWFNGPDRGDVVVFKVPEAIWDPTKPIYIKRAVGLPGDKISFNGRLSLNGSLVEEPKFFQHQLYKNEIFMNTRGFVKQTFVKYNDKSYPVLSIDEVEVPKDGIYVLGDNTRSSLDSRYWGVAPIENLKGKAFIRYWPLSKIKFIR